MQRFSHLDIPPKYQYLTGITILIPRSRFFDTILEINYWYHAFTFIPDQHWYFTCCTCETLQFWSTQLWVTDNIGFPWFGCTQNQGNSSSASQMHFKQHSNRRRNLHFLAYYKVMSPEFTDILLGWLELFWKDDKKQMDLIWGWEFQK